MAKLDLKEIKHIVRLALKEDVGRGDVTSRAVIPEGKRMRGKITAKAFGVIAGVDVARLVFETFDKRISVRTKVKDGARAFPGRVIMDVSGPARSVLASERTALNFLQRMSGIATTTRDFIRRKRFSKAQILGTRKTAPGLRTLDKYAVTVGGGHPHRMGLYDAVLIKENHADIAGGLRKALSLARHNAPALMGIEVEARTLQEVRDAIEAGANWILLDNMPRIMLSRAVRIVKKHNEKLGFPQGYIKTEASGGITLRNVAGVARTGVDAISVGALTHSPKALDMSLEVYS